MVQFINNGRPLYGNLRSELLAFRNADAETRQEILASKRQLLSVMKDVIDVENTDEGIAAYTQLADAATLIMYADALKRIENQEYFDILRDFSTLDGFQEILKQPEFARLNDFFELHPKAPQMRLRKPIAEITRDISRLFRAAQKAHLKAKNKEHLFDLDQLDIDHLPADQLYPLPIQMLGAYHNEAVDRIWGTAEGLYRFVEVFGFYLLGGEGMVEINGLEKTMQAKLLKMLDEHLEEQHGNLWSNADAEYNAIDREAFLKSLRGSTLDNAKVKPEYKEALAQALVNPDAGLTNAEILANVIFIIDSVLFPKYEKTDEAELNELRSSLVQVAPFKLTALYQEAVQLIEEDAVGANIEQLLDTRPCGGKQLSHSYLMFKADLFEFFRQRFLANGGDEPEAGDDIRYSKLVTMSLLQALAKFDKMKFSHLLIALTHQAESLKRGHMQLRDVWVPEQYAAARAALIASATQKMADIAALLRNAQGPAAAAVPVGAAAAVAKGQGVRHFRRASLKDEPRRGAVAPRAGAAAAIAQVGILPVPAAAAAPVASADKKRDQRA